MRALEVIPQLVLVGEASKRAVSDLGPGSLDRGRHGIVAHLGPPLIEQRRLAGALLRHGHQARSAAGDEGDHDVGGVAVEALSAVVIDRRGAGIRVPGGDLHDSGGEDNPSGPQNPLGFPQRRQAVILLRQVVKRAEESTASKEPPAKLSAPVTAKELLGVAGSVR